MMVAYWALVDWWLQGVLKVLGEACVSYFSCNTNLTWTDCRGIGLGLSGKKPLELGHSFGSSEFKQKCISERCILISCPCHFVPLLGGEFLMKGHNSELTVPCLILSFTYAHVGIWNNKFTNYIWLSPSSHIFVPIRNISMVIEIGFRILNIQVSHKSTLCMRLLWLQ